MLLEIYESAIQVLDLNLVRLRCKNVWS